MRTLLLMRGVAGSGKSTWIKENGLEQYTLEADKIRLLICNPTLDEDGDFHITQKNDKKVWHLLHQILEERMKRGDFTIVDGTHTSTKLLNQYKSLAEKYRYNIFYKQINTDLEEVIKRNSEREPYKRVPIEALKRMDLLMKETIPSKNIKKIDNISEIDNYFEVDLNNYDKIIIVGDIHSCNTALQELIDKEKSNNNFYIFVGDIFDRGLETIETFKFFDSIKDNKNVALLEGNHDSNLIEYAFDYFDTSKEFDRLKFVKKQTKPTIIELFDYFNNDEKAFKKALRQFYRTFKQCFKFIFNSQKYLVSHGGLTSVPNLTFVSTQELIKGVGDYETDIGEIYDTNYLLGNCQNIIQFHGHRNLTSGKYTYCLEDSVEFGGNLKYATITKELGIEIKTIKNNVFKIPDLQEINTEVKDKTGFITENEEINRLINSKLVGVNKLEDNLVSLNFTRNAFRKQQWTNQSIKARGLFVDRFTGDVKLRSYDKFFNYEQVPETTKNKLKENLIFPVKAHRKENGFLGLLSYVNDKLIFATKSTTNGEHVGYFKEIYYRERDDVREHIESYLKNNNVTILFEVISNKDRHLVDYNNKEHLFLLDIVENKLHINGIHIDKSFSTESKNKLNLQETLYIKNIEEVQSLDNFDELMKFISKADEETNTEGYILVDSQGFTFKLKNKYYLSLKQLRYTFQFYLKEMKKCNFFHKNLCRTHEELQFILWCEEQKLDKLKDTQFLDLYTEFKEILNK